MFDVSAAGHIAMGDDALETAVREMEEELGILTDEVYLTKLFTAISEASGETEKHGKYLCREFQEVYLVDIEQVEKSALSPVEIKVADGEVEEAKWIPQEDLISALITSDSTYVPRSNSYVQGLAKALGMPIKA
uniref:Nudix hydrolase domain-containing protein n=2 Tax=Lotharella oceanica TaxID=641309 RepID=A0A7S2TIC9_9EUKA|mmetsp:Transcript_13925/g.26574  ORF Transcript_13925/g.26574 Transcript_13925/m.26574 type:complete len:134 (+) Transcript_13925:371-772(+)